MQQTPNVADIVDRIDFSALVGRLAATLTGIAGEAGLILVYMLFLFVEQGSFDRKMKGALPRPGAGGAGPQDPQPHDPGDSELSLDQDFHQRADGGAQLCPCFPASGWTFAGFWAVIIFLLNYIPTIGSLLGILFPALLALVQFDTVVPFLIVTPSLAVIQVFIGNFLEPMLMGSSLNISPLATLVSLAVWGTIWGYTGDVPLRAHHRDRHDHLRPLSAHAAHRGHAVDRRPRRLGRDRAPSTARPPPAVWEPDHECCRTRRPRDRRRVATEGRRRDLPGRRLRRGRRRAHRPPPGRIQPHRTRQPRRHPGAALRALARHRYRLCRPQREDGDGRGRRRGAGRRARLRPDHRRASDHAGRRESARIRRRRGGPAQLGPPGADWRLGRACGRRGADFGPLRQHQRPRHAGGALRRDRAAHVHQSPLHRRADAGGAAAGAGLRDVDRGRGQDAGRAQRRQAAA